MSVSKRKIPLRLQYYAIIICISVILCAVSVAATQIIHTGFVTNRYQNLSENVAKTVSAIIDVNRFESYINGEDTLEYIEINGKIHNLKNTVPNVANIAVYRFMPDGMQVIFDTDSNDIKGGLGKVNSYDRSWREYKDTLIEGQTVKKADILVKQGRTLMHCMPVSADSVNGSVYVCVGILRDAVFGERDSLVRYIVYAIVSLCVALLVLAVLVFERKIVKPVKRICATVEDAANRHDSAFIHKIMESDLRSVNELENIYKSLLKIYTSKARLFGVSTAENNDSVDSIRSLIKRMDNFTASHLDNSLQYVILIVNELRKKDKYKDILTDKYVEEITLASPLHDIGKLVIPKNIVGKPGKLTDAEYEVMKKHASLGGKVIEEIYLKESDESYLHLARDIATYHHERWDGSGYPSKLKGEEIPLAVRIVSIADVFDALVSERVYKKAYSFEKSFEMIVSDSGKFFDPEIIEVVVELKDKIRDVHRRISNGL